MKQNIFLLILVLFLSACADELDLVNPNAITTETFWQTEDDVVSALAGTYKVFRDETNGQGYWGVRGVEMTNSRGDDVYIRNDVIALYQLSTFTSDATNGVAANLFTGAYNGIFRANQVIKYAAGIEMSDDTRNQLVAEAKFIRGLNYFNLVTNFGAVPIITSVPETREDYFVKQSPEADVWDQVIADFEEAKKYLPVSYSSEWVGRATQGAAIGYLGKTYLYLERWADAENEFKLLSQSNGYTQSPFTYDLMENYGDNFIKEYDNNKESLFEIQLIKVAGTFPWDAEGASQSLAVTTAQEFAPSEVGGWFEFFPTDKMFDEFAMEKTVDEDFDPRMYASIVWVYPGAVFYNRTFSESWLRFGLKSILKKYQNYMEDSEGNYPDWKSEINEKTLRYADVLLMYAEALTMQNKVTEAYPFVNRIRTRANLAELPAGMTETEMMAEIQHQRMIEFFREGLRFYDLRRWGLLGQEITDGDKVGKEYFNLDKRAYLPIPQDEINTNPNY